MHIVTDDDLDHLARSRAPVQAQIALFAAGLLIPSIFQAWAAIDRLNDSVSSPPFTVQDLAWCVLAGCAFVATGICGVNAARGKGEAKTLLDQIRDRKSMSLVKGD